MMEKESAAPSPQTMVPPPSKERRMKPRRTPSYQHEKHQSEQQDHHRQQRRGSGSSGDNKSRRRHRNPYAKTIEIKHPQESNDDTATIISGLTASTAMTSASAILATRKSLRMSTTERHRQHRRDGGGMDDIQSTTNSVTTTQVHLHAMINRIQKQRHAIIAMAFLSAICIPAILTRSMTDFLPSPQQLDNQLIRGGSAGNGDAASFDDTSDISSYFATPEENELEVELEESLHRNLMESFVEEIDVEGFVTPENWESTIATSTETASANASATTQTNSPKYTISPYNLTDVFLSADIFDNNYATVIWDPTEDLFIGYYSQRHYWVPGCSKLLTSIKKFTYMLKTLFPWRFQKGISAEFAFAISSGDFPAVKPTDCVMQRKSLPCAETAPILHFGSVFQRPLFPSMIAMPMPDGHHLRCFEAWVMHKAICSGLRSVSDGGELVFGDKIRKKWKELTPQVVWRGTDFGYLGTLYPNLDRPQYDHYIQGELGSSPSMARKETVRIMREKYNGLVPRWQGVVHTAEAEMEASKKTNAVPWANIKFSNFIHRGKRASTLGALEYQKWMDVDFPVAGEGMSLEDLAHYRYHIDLGGGGETCFYN